jgi:hypothetical protein
MRSSRRLAVFAATALIALSSLAVSGQQRTGPKFRIDDPLLVDNDRVVDVGKLPEWEDGDIYDFIAGTFLKPGSEDDIPALNVNTIDEVPDSSWFTNR